MGWQDVAVQQVLSMEWIKKALRDGKNQTMPKLDMDHSCAPEGNMHTGNAVDPKAIVVSARRFSLTASTDHPIDEKHVRQVPVS